MLDKPLIIIGGATGSGKTALALALCKKYPQLVLLSADSRQIYKRLDIGSAKIGEKGIDHTLTGQAEPVWIAEGISQFLIDIAEPNTNFSLTDYQREAYRLIQACWDKEKIPLLVGGTGLYLQAIAEGYTPEGAPDIALRLELEKLSLVELQQKLSDIGGAVIDSDAKNKRRVIRAIERAMHTQSGVTKQPITKNVSAFVLTRDWTEQRDLAPDMVQERLDLGLIVETKQLLNSGIDKAWLKSMGLSYRLVIRMLDGEFLKPDLKAHMINEFRQLMRRQRTWFNRMPNAQKLARPELIQAVDSLLAKSV